MSKSDDNDNTLMMSERDLRSRADGPHGASCARYGLGRGSQAEPTWACFSVAWCEPRGQCPAAACCRPGGVACLHTSTFVTLSSPPPHLKADPQGQWTKNTTGEATVFLYARRMGGCKKSFEGSLVLPDVLQSIRLTRLLLCATPPAPPPIPISFQ